MLSFIDFRNWNSSKVMSNKESMHDVKQATKHSRSPNRLCYCHCSVRGPQVPEHHFLLPPVLEPVPIEAARPKGAAPVSVVEVAAVDCLEFPFVPLQDLILLLWTSIPDLHNRGLCDEWSCELAAIDCLCFSLVFYNGLILFRSLATKGQLTIALLLLYDVGAGTFADAFFLINAFGPE